MPNVLKTVGRYEVLREVGRGGMAIVYLARQTDLDRFVALKELAAFHASDPAFAQRFLRESRVAGSLSHPNIVTVHDYFEHDGTPYIAMEYVERGSLRPWVGNLTLAQIGGVLEGLLAGLAQAEQHGVVHRDLKPENLMVTSDGRVKIADFGIAKATNQMQTGAFLTATGTTVGTPTYMAPEQAMAQDIGPWTDLYSAGCMAFEMFTGRVPFHDSDAPMAILLRHVNEEIPPVSSIDPSVDESLSAWVQALLVKDPKARTQSANGAWDELEELIIGILGPRWRREARLSAEARAADTPKPLTPAPFDGAPPESEPSDEFRSFGWGGAGPATPPPTPAPEGPLEPGEIDVPTGPPTPPPLGESGFLTFGVPPAADTPPATETPAAGTPPADAPPSSAAPPADTPPPVATPPADTPPPAAPPPADTPPATTAAAGGDSGFMTFGAPPVGEPPVDEPAAAEPPADAPTPAFETYNPPPPLTPPVEAAPPADTPPPADAPPPAATPPEPEPAGAAVPRSDDDVAATAMPRALREEPQTAALDEKPAPGEPRERRSLAFPLALVGALVVAVVAGLLIGGGGGDDPPAPAPQSTTPETPVEAGSLGIEVPASWKPLATAPAISGLELADAAAFAPGGRDGGRGVELGMGDASDSTLLPRDLRQALGLGAGEVPERTAVALGPDDVQAYRYQGLEPAGSNRSVTLYAAPTSAGVATVACLARSADAEAFAPDCEAMADTLDVGDATPFPVGPDPSYAKTLDRTLGALDRKVASGRRALGRDGVTFRAQARAARGIQAGYAQAARQLRRADISPADRTINAVLVDRLTVASGAWKNAAAQASQKDKGGFRRSETAIRRNQRQLARALAGLEAAGYRLQR